MRPRTLTNNDEHTEVGAFITPTLALLVGIALGTMLEWFVAVPNVVEEHLGKCDAVSGSGSIDGSPSKDSPIQYQVV